MEKDIELFNGDCLDVLDNTMRSGGTGIACVNTNRKFIGIEIEKGYYSIAKERIEKKTVEEKQK